GGHPLREKVRCACYRATSPTAFLPLGCRDLVSHPQNSWERPMTRLVLICLSSCVGVIGFGALHHAAQQNRSAAATTGLESVSATNELAEMEQKLASTRVEVMQKKHRLQQAIEHEAISPELLHLLESGTGTPPAWTELRQHLGIGWDSSPDYVLVGK